MNPELNKKLFQLYQKAAHFINNAEPDDVQLEIINAAADILVEHEPELLEEAPEYVAHILGKCLAYINKDFEDGVNPTLDEYVGMGYDLVEELSGYLGTYFE